MTNAVAGAQDMTMLEILDRLLDRGVVLAGDLTISVADVDLIFVGLKVILSSVERIEQMRSGASSPLAFGGSDG